MINRNLQNGGHALLFGRAGCGKTFFVKREITALLATRKDIDVIVVDTNRDYKQFCDQLEGTYINLNEKMVNPLDLAIKFDVYGEDKNYYISDKTDEIISLIEMMANKTLSIEEIKDIEKAMSSIYDAYFDSIPLEAFKNGSTYYIDRDKSPILTNLYHELSSEKLKMIIEPYLYTCLNGKNFTGQSRLTVYNISDISHGIKSVMYTGVLIDVMNKIKENNNKGHTTYVYLEDLQILINLPVTERIKTYVKRFRKNRAVFTGISQRFGDFLTDSNYYCLLNNSDYIYLFNLISDDVDKLVDLGVLTKRKSKKIDLEMIPVNCGYVYIKNNKWRKFHINTDSELKEKHKDAYYKGLCYNKNAYHLL